MSIFMKQQSQYKVCTKQPIKNIKHQVKMK